MKYRPFARPLPILVRASLVFVPLTWAAPIQATTTALVDVGLFDRNGVLLLENADGAVSGSVYESAAASSTAIYSPSVAEAYADVSGTFWASAQAGTILPYETRGTAVVLESGTRSAGINAAFADIVGGTMELVDFGGGPGLDLFAELSFTIHLNNTLVHSHMVRLEGRGGFAGNDFKYTRNSTLPGADDIVVRSNTSTGYVFAANYLLSDLRVTIDLSSIAIGDPFELRYLADVGAANAGGETSASAWFRDPASMDGAITVSYGLLPTSEVPGPAPGVLLLFGLIGLAGLRVRGRWSAVHAPQITSMRGA